MKSESDEVINWNDPPLTLSAGRPSALHGDKWGLAQSGGNRFRFYVSALSEAMEVYLSSQEVFLGLNPAAV